MTALARVAVCVVAFSLASCATSVSLDPALAAALATEAARVAPPFRETARVRLTTDVLRGDFQSVLVGSPGAAPRARLQLFPEIGGKILDVAATPARITGVMPHAEQRVDVRLDRGDEPPRHLLFFIGVTLLERGAPLAPERVTACTRDGERFVLALEPVVAGTGVTAVVDASGRVLERRYAFRGAKWVERVESIAPAARSLEISGPGFDMTVERGAPEPLDVVPDDLFTLRLPGSDGAP